jgi:predicted nuclease of restriction endonuclease-like (RecB) superfamily
LQLIAVSDPNARSFYEQEAVNSDWSVRELGRQIESSLFERVLLSDGKANKKKVLRLAQQGVELARPEDMLKRPYVFDFIGNRENKPLLERDLEERLKRHIEDFLLERSQVYTRPRVRDVRIWPLRQTPNDLRACHSVRIPI